MATSPTHHPRPSTHPVEEYQRAQAVATLDLQRLVYLLARLDPDEQARQGWDTLDLLETAAQAIDDVIAGRD